MTLADNNKYYYTERNRCVLPVQPVQVVQACTGVYEATGCTCRRYRWYRVHTYTPRYNNDTKHQYDVQH